MKNMFFPLALICAVSLVQAEVAVETVKAGAACVVLDKAGCPICPEKSIEANAVVVADESVVGQEDDATVVADASVTGQEDDEVKCGCGKPKPGKSAE